MQNTSQDISRAQISRQSIERLYISMRHLFLRGKYKPLGMSGAAMIDALLALNPEIYGLINDPEKVELEGLLYIFQRLPKGIEQCRYTHLITREGYEDANFEALVPSKRRRNCYRLDKEQMMIEMTRGLSDIFDCLTHLTFMFIESEKIRKNALDSKNRETRAWKMLREIVENIGGNDDFDEQVGFSYLSSLLGRTYDDVKEAYGKFEDAAKINSLFEIVYWMGEISIQEYINDVDREIVFSPSLRERIGHHLYGESWANQIKAKLVELQLYDRPIHIISANLHSVMNCFFASSALKKNLAEKSIEEIAEVLSDDDNKALRKKVKKYALSHGMYELHDSSGTNISVQIFDLEKVNKQDLTKAYLNEGPHKEVIIVMDYAFGQQAYETMDELLKPYKVLDEKQKINIQSVNIMGKAGILTGEKGDIMIPSAHIFEGSADNYPFENALKIEMFQNQGIGVFEGPMITVLGTSLQNKDILRYFMRSSWGVIGLEMEGAHYQKAIQSASKIRHSISADIDIRYAYYASDNPLESGATLASGSLGLDGVKPTYLITLQILKGILG
jgi:hypothetical protein